MVHRYRRQVQTLVLLDLHKQLKQASLESALNLGVVEPGSVEFAASYERAQALLEAANALEGLLIAPVPITPRRKMF